MQSFSRLVLHWAGTISLLGILLGGVGVYYSVQLYKNLRTDVEELLPTTARSVVDLAEVTRRLESIDNLSVLIFSPKSSDAAAAKRFQVDLARKLESLPRDVVASVEYKIDRELEFFRARQALYMELGDLTRIRDYIRDRIEYERELYNPLNIFREEDIPEPKLDLMALRSKYAGQMSSYDRFPEGHYATPDGKIRVVIANMPGKTGGIGQIEKLRAAADQAIAELNPKSYAPDLEIKFTGGAQDTLEEHHALVEDLELSTVIVAIIVTLALWFFYRSALATWALNISVFIGTFWTFGTTWFLVGYLNANSAFLGAIVLGNGINFGIIYLARYLEERRSGKDNAEANTIAMTHTATSTWTAALAAGLSYGSLMLTSFRGFSQFGVIGLVGMVLCWISAFTVLPAFLTVMDRITPLVKPGEKPSRSLGMESIAKLIERVPGPIWYLSIAATVVSLAMLTRYDSSILETDLSKLRNRHSLESGSAYLSKYMDEIFQRYMSPLAILPKTREQAREIAQKLRERREKEGPGTLINSVQTLDDFLPRQQEEKIQILQQIRRLLPPRLVQRLSEADQKLVSQFLNPAAFKPIYQTDLPPLLLRKFTEKDGSIGKMVLVEPPLNKSIWEGDKLISFIEGLRETADSVNPGTPVAGSNAITADMIRAVRTDGPRATLFAFAAVIILVVVLFRSLETVTLVLFALVLGMIWLAGLIFGFWFKINFLNFIALPITFGIGVDYGVNMFQRFRLEGSGSILKVIRDTGGAVALCSFTTVVGYSSLLIASNQGFVSFGTLAVVGELTCVLAAIFSLPAYLILRDRRANSLSRESSESVGDAIDTT